LQTSISFNHLATFVSPLITRIDAVGMNDRKYGRAKNDQIVDQSKDW